jgi:hypothetical protein
MQRVRIYITVHYKITSKEVLVPNVDEGIENYNPTK